VKEESREERIQCAMQQLALILMGKQSRAELIKSVKYIKETLQFLR